MIKFFRGTRQDSVKENKFGKYVIYAIGEILLIVIGILIALSASNYSEHKKAMNQSNIYLQDMLEDLASDTVYLELMLSKLEEQLKIEEWLLHKDRFDDKDIDSLKLAVSKVKWTFDMNDRSFLNIQNSSDVKLIGYEELYSRISKYYIITKGRIEQNNQIEIQKLASKSEFEQVVEKNLLITARQYMDYTGVQVGIDFSGAIAGEDIEKIFSSLSTVQTKNSLNEKYARHSFIYLALIMCDFDAKQLIKTINLALEK